MKKIDIYTLMDNAIESLRGKWKLAILTILVYMLTLMIIQSIPFVGAVISLIISGPFALGVAIFSLAISRNNEAKIEQLFQGFDNFKLVFEAYIRMIVYIVLWTILLVIPGIIAALSYSMTFYILADNPTFTAQEALNRSKQIMDGNKLTLFYLGLLFFVLAILCIFTLGIGFLWFFPFVHVTMAKFYDEITTTNQM